MEVFRLSNRMLLSGEFLGLYILLYMALSGLANLMAVISPVSLFLIYLFTSSFVKLFF